MMKRIIAMALGLTLVGGSALAALYWFTFRFYVPENRCAILVRKSGKELPPGEKVASEPGQKGIQPEVLGPGRYFRNPYTWEWRIVDQTEIPSGNPTSWRWVRRTVPGPDGRGTIETYVFEGDFPKVGVVTRKIGKPSPTGDIIVDRASGHEGILREVLTPGIYKINPEVYKVELYDAAVIPPGQVGVVTNLFGDQPEATKQATAETPTTQPTYAAINRPLAKPGERGTLADVLQPGVYFINPKLQKVTPIDIGYNEYSQVKLNERQNYRISFPSDTGYLIRVGVTVVWGIDPVHAAEIINEFGNAGEVLDKIIGPQLRSICRNIGSTYSARDFIQGEEREKFQNSLTLELKEVCRKKNIDVLLALVREIEVLSPDAAAGNTDVGETLKQTIQQSHIAIENQITKEKQREAAIVKAKLEESLKEVDIARETIGADTGVKVANTRAEGEKTAAEIQAQASLDVAGIMQEVAELEAKRIEILGAANADVEKMVKTAEADGYRMLVEAFGSPKAYNLYSFAEGFQPQSIRLFYAGEGTFWTDLSKLEEAGAAKLLSEKK